MFRNHIAEKVDLCANYLWILVCGFLIVVWTWPTRSELWMLYELWNPAWSDACYTTCLSEQVIHIFHQTYSWWKSLLIQVKNPSENKNFFKGIWILRIGDSFCLGVIPLASLVFVRETPYSFAAAYGVCFLSHSIACKEISNAISFRMMGIFDEIFDIANIKFN